MYSNQELSDVHFVYGLAEVNAVVARRLYQEICPGRRCSDRKTFVSIHRRLCEHGNFAPLVANRGRPKSTTSEVEVDIPDIVNKIPGNSTGRVSTQVGVAHSSGWRLLREQHLCPYHVQGVQVLPL
jgi:hypothetical protein